MESVVDEPAPTPEDANTGASTIPDTACPLQVNEVKSLLNAWLEPGDVVIDETDSVVFETGEAMCVIDFPVNSLDGNSSLGPPGLVIRRYRYVDAMTFSYSPANSSESYDWGGMSPTEVFNSYVAAMRHGESNVNEFPESPGGIVTHHHSDALIAISGDFYYDIGFNLVIPDATHEAAILAIARAIEPNS